MKTVVGGADTDPNAHQRFNTWDEGVQAHLDHLALYAGATDYPRSNTYDPRHFVTVKGNAVTVNALGGKWAQVLLTYGEEVNESYNDLLISAGIVSKPKTETDASKVTDNIGKTSEAANSSTNTTTTGSTPVADKTQTNTTAPAGVQKQLNQ